MLKRLLLIVVTVFLLLLLADEALSRQGCGRTGCPTSVPAPDGRGTPDRDGDGVPDYVDPCPDAVGSGYTNGCPVEGAPDAQGDAPPAPNANPNNALVFPTTEACMLGSTQQVNVRQFPSTGDAIVGHLASGEVVDGIFGITNPLGEFWFLTAMDGFVHGDVVGTNGHCDNLLHVQVKLGTTVLHVDEQIAEQLKTFPLHENLNSLSAALSATSLIPADDPWEAFVNEMASAGGAIDPNALVQEVLRQSYLQTTEDLRFYAEKVKYFNQCKELIREYVQSLRDYDEKMDGATPEPTQSVGMGAGVGSALGQPEGEDEGGVILIIPRGDVEDCPFFAEWVGYPDAVNAGLDTLTPVEPDEPCMVEILYPDDEAAGAQGSPYDVVLNSVMIRL